MPAWSIRFASSRPRDLTVIMICSTRLPVTMRRSTSLAARVLFAEHIKTLGIHLSLGNSVFTLYVFILIWLVAIVHAIHAYTLTRTFVSRLIAVAQDRLSLSRRYFRSRHSWRSLLGLHLP